MLSELISMSGTQRRLVTSHNTDCLLVKLCLFPVIAFHLVSTYANLGRCHTATQKISMSKKSVPSTVEELAKLP